MDSVEIKPGNAPVKMIVIWLHGLGADGHDFVPIVPQLGLSDELGVKFIFPHAPHQAVTINNGLRMRAWYDIHHPDLAVVPDIDGIRRSTQLIKGTLEQAFTEVDKVVLAGFSQGGVISLFAGLRYPRRLSGVLALSTYLADHNALAAERSEANREVPILMMHGVDDPIIPLADAERSRDELIALAYAVEWMAYPMPHSVHPQQMSDIGRWLRRLALATK